MAQPTRKRRIQMKKQHLSNILFAVVTIASLFALAACSPKSGPIASGAQSTATPSASTAATSSAAPAATSAAVNPTGAAEKTFTKDELAKYDGRTGNPAYIAVDGVVYDVSNVRQWKSGSHEGNSAGQDLTEAIKQAPHGKSVLEGLPVVGKYVN